ncbi:MAG: choice-of-anchor N protein [Nitrospirae bacterium]|nr:choice-of-anchor N protein [Nitrospirota bacterium]
MKKALLILTVFTLLIIGLAPATEAVPTLQIGAPAGPGDAGAYADYLGSLVNPIEEDTAVTLGSVLFAAGVYGNNTRLLGGQFTSVNGNGLNWSDFGFNSTFNARGAVLMATVPALHAGSLTINGNPSFYSTGTFEDGFVVPNPPSNHDPVKDISPDKQYLFFDIGNFANNAGVVPDFSDETGAADGEIKQLTLLTSGFDWIHFDVFALETIEEGGGPNTRLVTNLEGNPGSHDVTWKPVPEPGTFMLLGGGLICLVLYGREKLRR